MAVIFVLSAQPSFPRGPDPVLDVVLRKLAHLSEYAVLAILVTRALAGTAAPSSTVAMQTMAIVLAYAISDEIHQAFVPNRMPSAVDVLVDVAGGLIGVGIFRAWVSIRRQRSHTPGLR
jgi:VanZ family protein